MLYEVITDADGNGEQGELSGLVLQLEPLQPLSALSYNFV